jgi:hypothetical protein
MFIKAHSCCFDQTPKTLFKHLNFLEPREMRLFLLFSTESHVASALDQRGKFKS